MLSEAWTIGSLDYGAAEVRTGLTILALLTNDELVRLVHEVSRELQKIPARCPAQGVRRHRGELRGGGRQRGGGRCPGRWRGGAVPGKTPNLDQYTVDLTERARQGKIDPVLGRDFEIRQVVDILTRRRQNNPILVGEAGVGKTAVVEGFALRIADGDVPPPLRNVTLRTLDLALLQAGAGVKGEFENRLKGLIEEVKIFADADHSLHRRSAHHDRRGRAGRAGRCRQPAEAGAGARRAAHHRRHHLVRVQEVLREGPGAGPPLPAGQGRRADRRRSAC